MDVKSSNDLDPTSVWFRDTLYKAFSWGMAILGLLVAWLVKEDDVFAFSECEGVGQFFEKEACSGAWIVSVTALLLIPFWIYSLNRLWSSVPPHPTRLQRRELNLYAVVVAAAGLIVLLSAVKD